MNKKGFFAAEVQAFFFSILTFIVAALLFFLLFSMKGCTDGNIDQSISSTNNLSPELAYLSNIYLRSLIETDLNNDKVLETITVAELISWSAVNNDYSLLNEYTSNFFKDKVPAWKLTLLNENGLIKTLYPPGPYQSGTSQEFSYILPHSTLNPPIIVAKLSLYTSLTNIWDTKT